MPFPVDNIRAACQKQGTTLAEVERALGIGNGVIAKWEKKKGSPPYDRIIAIAEHLRVPVSDLTGEGQKIAPHPKVRSLMRKLCNCGKSGKVRIRKSAKPFLLWLRC